MKLKHLHNIPLFFSFLAVFVFSVGMPLLHPVFHHHEDHKHHNTCDSTHAQKFKPLKIPDDCSICNFFSTVRLFGNSHVAAQIILKPLLEKTWWCVLLLPKKVQNPIIPSRAPPFSTSNNKS